MDVFQNKTLKGGGIVAKKYKIGITEAIINKNSSVLM